MGESTPQNGTEETSSIFTPDTKVLVTILLVLFFAGTLIGNSLVIAVVYKNVNKKMRTTINLFVANIAASDLLTTVLSVPTLYWTVVASTYLSDPDESAEYFDLCKVSSLVWLFSSGNSLLSLVAISFDRFLAVFIPTKQPLTRRKPRVVFIIIWLSCIGFAILPALVEPVECGAQLRSVFYIYFLSLYSILYVGMPTVTILLLYPAILIKLWCRRIPGNPSTANQELRNRTNRKVTILAAALTISFAFSWFPYVANTIMYLVEKPSAHQKEYKLFRNVAFILMYSYSVWNPLICLILNVNFRSGFKTIIGTFCSCLFVSIGNFCKPKNEIAKLSSSAIDCGQELNVIQLTSINNLKENCKNDFV